MSGGEWVTIDQHWCLVEDGSRVVPETDPEARWLHWSPGTVVLREEAERLGAVKPAAKPAPAEAKKAPPAANKQARPAQNKGR
ncbi:hypothetical protein ACIP79_00435 [Streptomyces sp. NPDC088747]|uniref:hypothetical protein n=1 Tax=Streptomyces sp. NPDC088747 TaxID=3365886 RepID=UPI0037F79301